MGTPEFAVPSLNALVDADYTPVAVATGPDRPRGRGQKMTPTPVKKAAQDAGIDTILQPESVKDPQFADDVAALEPDVIVVVAFKILPAAVFTTAKQGAFNLHGSLLPKYRGAAPINRAVMDGATETGVTTFFLKAKVDTGDLILQKRMPIGPNETAGELHDRLKMIGATAVVVDPPEGALREAFLDARRNLGLRTYFLGTTLMHRPERLPAAWGELFEGFAAGRIALPIESLPLEEAAKNLPELEAAIDLWGTETPR